RDGLAARGPGARDGPVASPISGDQCGKNSGGSASGFGRPDLFGQPGSGPPPWVPPPTAARRDRRSPGADVRRPAVSFARTGTVQPSPGNSLPSHSLQPRNDPRFHRPDSGSRNPRTPPFWNRESRD